MNRRERRLNHDQINKSTNQQSLTPPHLLTALTLAALIATAGGNSFGWDGLWMFALLAHIPLWLRLLLAAPILLAPFWVDPEVRLLKKVELLRPSHPLILPFAALAFWLFRERTLHGDGPGKVFLHTTATLQTDPVCVEGAAGLFAGVHLVGIF